MKKFFILLLLISSQLLRAQTTYLMDVFEYSTDAAAQTAYVTTEADMGATDYFEIWYTASNNNDIITLSDLQIGSWVQ